MRYPVRPKPVLHHALPGVRMGRLWAVERETVTALIDALRLHRCVSSSGLYGSLLVYRDDNDCFRCVFHDAGNCIPVSAETFVTNEPQVHGWLQCWIPKLHTAPKRRAAE